MSHYEERLQADLDRLRSRVVAQGEAVERALERATRAFLAADRQTAAEVMLGDNPINRTAREIDRLCHAFVARHVPSAGHLRFVSSVMRMSIALERVGDYAVTISRETAQASTVPPEAIAADIEMMGVQGRMVLHQAIEAFRSSSADLARGTLALSSQQGRTFHRVFTDLLREGQRGTRAIEDLFGILVVLYRLERVGDQAKNLCEDVIFLATGQMKPPKVYSILFLDARNTFLSQMAEAVAHKAFPESGRYASAGWAPADRLDARVADFLDSRGFDVRAAGTTWLDASHEALADVHVIVSLEGDARPHIPNLPFHTVLTLWDVGDPAAEPTEAVLEAAQRRLSERIRALMETLRGEGAG